MSLKEINWDLPIITLIIANLVPIYGILFLNWSLLYILLFYWMESAVIGFFNIIKMYMSSIPLPPAAKYGKRLEGPTKNIRKIIMVFMKIILPPFFLVHYGGFMAVHLLFIFLISSGFSSSGISIGFESITAILASIILPLLALLISHGLSFFINFIGKKEYQKTNIGELMISPYKRIIVMHITLILGGFIMILTRAPVYILILFILLKIFIDIRAHTKEHLKISFS